jgi:PAS domain S-box-containing protein
MKASSLYSQADYQEILDSINDGVLTVTKDHVIISFNRAAEAITGVPRAEAVGRKCYEVMRAEICESKCCLKHTMTTGEPCENLPVYIVRADNKRIPISVNTSVMHDSRGRVRGMVETFRDLSEIHNLRREFMKKQSFENIVSKNHKMMELFSILPQIAESHSTILIEGASGTGKELFARAIHNNSFNSKGPFVAVNCCALPDTLIESELFGYMAGAFTDAKKNKPGRFSQAQNGTIFLDEIGDVSPAMQVRLLRVLESRQYEPLGSTKSIHTNARVIAATHQNLEDLVRRGKFREDLYFRINVVKLSLPVIAERNEDIPLLVNHFIEKFNHLNGKNVVGISREAMAVLMLYDWPGNVRELENAIEHAFVLCQGDMIRLAHLPERIVPQDASLVISTDLTLKEIEKRSIQTALHRNRWRKVATARELGIDKNTLRRKIQRLGIEKPV